jgi:pimeloyl-ACP methyl ester carboxylesterase
MPYAINDGVRIRYVVEGSGPPLMLHIGFIGAVEDWYDAGYVAALRDDYQLILLDPRGQGQSDKPHDPGAYTRSQRINDVCAVLNAVGVDRAHYWGYSMGGQIGYALGVFAPERVSSLILGGASPYRYPDETVEDHPLYKGLQLGMAGMVAEFEGDDPEYWASDGERSRWLASDAVALTAAFRTGFSNPSLADHIRTVQTPTLIYCGTEDHPELKEQAARDMPNATFVPLDGLNHASAINRSELVLPHVTAFLAQVEEFASAER